MVTGTVWCLLVDHKNDPIGTPFVIEVVVGKSIAVLKEKVKEMTLITPPVHELIVWRCTDRTIDFGGDELRNHVREAFSHGKVKRLHERQTMASLRLEEEETLLVQMPAPNIPGGTRESDPGTKKRGFEAEDIVAKRQRFREAQESDIKAARAALPPSSAAALPAYQNAQEKRPVLNGRPHHNSGLPVGLFHPVFNSFHAAIRSPEPFYADAKTYSLLRALFKAFAGIYDTKEKRIAAIDKHLRDLLGSQFIVVEGAGVKSDGVISQNCGATIAYLAIREIKNEIGTASTDPYNQGSLAYRKYWAGEPQDAIRRNSHCPSIILAIAGPWLCVLGGVYLQKAVIQPLTDYVWLGGDNFSEDRLLFASRLFAALKSAVSTLKLYYDDLAPRLLNPISQDDISDAFPFITEYESKKFAYLSRLTPDYPNKLLFKAKLDDEHRIVVVKFVLKYHAEAHRILADHQLAPALHYAGTEAPVVSMYGGRYMIVMDFVEGEPAVGSLLEHQFEKVKQAIQLLHSHNLVFGDLRSPNILTTGKKVMIIDFDWCGKAGETRYPASLNTADELGWPEGVEPDSVMLKEHDLVMLEKLRSRFYHARRHSYTWR
ncbi:hypothetical protein D9756_000153 [Leucocoprinus leucothites]|uniref:Protein kinase domain-containing protein n=1 Tax=Leucocoprinus leucothites TaxID=201217 RepID=A0A8H5GEN6_9AGAR|nr:hypothetical protein D9756_000153 [Leucoagaricus leucothites]